MVLIIAGCSLEKKSGFNRVMQNLTAHYNILFNANEILRQKQADYTLSFVDAYGNLLSVYQDTIAERNAADKDLEAAIQRANLIINEKEQSKYLGYAYLVLGKANYLGANYFNAAEYFSYITISFNGKKSMDLVQEARVWKARSLIYLKNLPEARVTLDSALKNINPKKNITADVYATMLAYDMATQDYTDGEQMAKKAIAYSNNKSQKIRWTFILAQLQELNGHKEAAVNNYTKIVKSNAAFEMAFNADLNRIRITDERNGIRMSRIERLLSLLKNQNNRDFTDQIYYQIGEIYLANNDIDNAVKNYNLSLRARSNNQNQKGLAYLRMADINFKNKADYVSAKKYYDSTLTNLSPNYPGYLSIQKKSSNLQLLADRLHIISREDTLQMLAKMDEKTRLEIIDSMVTLQTLQRQMAATTAALPNVSTASVGATASLPNGNNFYFYNASAVSQGFNEFKRRWGNRKLEDNWRRSNRSNTDISSITVPGSAPSGDPDAPLINIPKGANEVTASAYRQSLLQNMPVTPPLLAQSNTRIYNAYLDIANFYRDILEDKKEAITYYLLILNKFPNDPNKAAIYYSLYRLYSDTDVARADEYKNELLKEFPQSTFARVIIDPEYGRRIDDNDALFNTSYNQIYDLFLQRKYLQVITNVDGLLRQYPNNKFSSQLSYLRAIAGGHQEALPPFQYDLQQIVAQHPDDALITPLVKQHLDYINANREMLATKTLVLSDNDTSGFLFTPPIAYQKETPYRRGITVENVAQQRVEPRPAAVIPPVTPIPVVNAPVLTQRISQQPSVTQQPVTNAPILAAPTEPALVVTQVEPQPAKPSIFNEKDNTNYYFVVNVSTGTTDLSTSRFGIGQFNRANFMPTAIKHQLKNAGADNQLVYVGPFKNLEAVKVYARDIVPLMPQTMKVSKDKYSFFIITKENLDKLASKELLDSYIDYYQKTY
jgi:tetratricopeptide (TPR) repeat protein